MAELFQSGRIIDLILTLTVAEAAALAMYRRLTGHGPALGDYLFMLLAGIFLMLGIRAALAGAWWGWLALSLLGALVAHLVDLARRWHL